VYRTRQRHSSFARLFLAALLHPEASRPKLTSVHCRSMLTRAVMGAAGSAREDFGEWTKLVLPSECQRMPT
jgi:hypothetical protein